MHVCFCVCFSFSVLSSKPRDWLRRTSPKWPILCRVGHKTTTQAINPRGVDSINNFAWGSTTMVGSPVF